MKIRQATSASPQPRKVKKIINSPDKRTVTGLTENVISTNNMMPYNIENDQLGNPTIRKIFLQKVGLFYEGSILNNFLHGEGILYQSDPSRYTYKGSWVRGARDGFGHYVYPNGQEYRGQWKNNNKEGQGIYSNTLGQKYEGAWTNNQRNGVGKMQFKNKAILEGNWVNDQFKDGSITFPDNGKYSGKMKDFTRNGTGSYSYPNNNKYIGQWSANNREGRGKIYYFNEDEFNGQFLDGKKHGRNCTYIWKRQGYILQNGHFEHDKFINGQVNRIR